MDYQKLMELEGPVIERSYTSRDTMLYALGLGVGADPMNRDELSFVYEKNLKTLPTMATVVTWADAWLNQAGVDMVKVVHGEQRLTIHRPLPVAASVISKVRVLDAFDKGADKGALILVESATTLADTGEPLCTGVSTVFARGDGGFGGKPGPAPTPHPLPERAPDAVMVRATLPQAALIYRLSGDYNPLHADPDFAAEAGFQRPILHGLCTYGVAGFAVVETMLGHDADQIANIDVRFSAPVYPGENITTEMWRDGDVISFRARVAERDVTVLQNGRVQLRT
jgi:acyl dehydratase